MKNSFILILVLGLFIAPSSLRAMEDKKPQISHSSYDDFGDNPEPVVLDAYWIHKFRGGKSSKSPKKILKKIIKGIDNHPKISIAVVVTVAIAAVTYKTCPVVKKHVNKAAAFVSDKTKAGYNWTASKLEGKVTKAQAAVGVTAIAAVVAGVIFRNEIKSAAVSGFDKAKACFKKEEAAQN